MDRHSIFTLSLLSSLFFESSLVSFPLVFPISLVYYLAYPTAQTVLVSSVFGLLSDVLCVSELGNTPLAILVAYLFIELYKKVFDTRDLRVVVPIIFLATYLYAKLVW